MSGDPCADVRGGVERALAHARIPALRVEDLRRDGNLWRALVGSQQILLRRIARRDATATAATAVWLDRLAAAGIPAPRPQRFAGSALIPFERDALFAVAWLRGTPIADAGWDASQAAALGALLARSHALSAGEPIPGARRYDAAWAGSLAPRLAPTAALLAADAADIERVQAGLARAQELLARAWRGGAGGPVRMIHADVHAGNVIETARSPRHPALAFIDVARAGLAPVMLDVAFALLDHEPPTAWALLRGYRRQRPLGEADLKALSSFRALAIADNLAFLSAFPEERAHVERTWATLITTCVASLSGREETAIDAAS